MAKKTIKRSRRLYNKMDKRKRKTKRKMRKKRRTNKLNKKGGAAAVNFVKKHMHGFKKPEDYPNLKFAYQVYIRNGDGTITRRLDRNLEEYNPQDGQLRKDPLLTYYEAGKRRGAGWTVDQAYHWDIGQSEGSRSSRVSRVHPEPHANP